MITVADAQTFSARTLAFTIGLSVACLVQLAAADSLDISVKLYRDANCFERAEELLLLDNGCYANLYSNLTKAYQIKIIDFDDPGRSDLFEYLDDCNALYRPKRTLLHARCERFIGGFWAIIGTRLRSNTCVGSSCSTLVVAVQDFFAEAGCVGLAYVTQRYAMQNACLRYYNGSQAFRLDLTGKNITQVNYVGNDLCGGEYKQTFTMENGRCYPLFDNSIPGSFKWRAERGVALASSSYRKFVINPNFGPNAIGLALLVLLVVAVHDATSL